MNDDDLKKQVSNPSSTRARLAMFQALGNLAKRDEDPELQEYVDEKLDAANDPE